MSEQLDDLELVEKFKTHQRPSANPRTRIISYVPSMVLTQNAHGFSKTPFGLSEMINPSEVDHDGVPIGTGTVIVNGIHQPVRKIRWKVARGKYPHMSFVYADFEVLSSISQL